MKNFKSVFLTISILFISFSFLSQENPWVKPNSEKNERKTENSEMDSVYGHFIMVNSADTSKNFKLRDVGNYHMGYVEYLNDTITLEKVYYLTWNIRDLHKTKLEFDVISETIEHNFKDTTTINTQIDYSSFYYSKMEKPRIVNLKDIKYIDYSSPTRSVIHASGMSIMILSAATALIVAPMFSIDFKSNSMDVKSYLNIAKIGLLGVAVGFPISRFSKIKRFNLTNSKKKNDRDFWYLAKENE